MIQMELKNCPFCGGEAREEIQYSEKNGCYYTCIACSDCHARSKTVKTSEDPANDDKTLFRALAAWNLRV